jgi:hypothetical protein
MDGFSENSIYALRRGAITAAISFTEEELDSVRLPLKKRTRIGSVPVGPGLYRQRPWQWR